MISCARAIAWAAPPMSFFIHRMPPADLMSRPPLSKQTPLPMMAMRGSPALPHSSSIRRGARAATGAAHRGDQADSLPPGLCRMSPGLRRRAGREPARTACSSSAGPRSAAGVSTRSRTRAVASARRIGRRSARLAGDQPRGPRSGSSASLDRRRTGAGRATSRARRAGSAPSSR